MAMSRSVVLLQLRSVLVFIVRVTIESHASHEPLPTHVLEKTIPTPHLKGWSQWPGLTDSSLTHAYIQGFELVFPNIYPTYDLWKNVKGLVL